MTEINKLISLIVAYIERGFEFTLAHVMTIEGIIALLLGVFFLSLIVRIRN